MGCWALSPCRSSSQGFVHCSKQSWASSAHHRHPLPQQRGIKQVLGNRRIPQGKGETPQGKHPRASDCSMELLPPKFAVFSAN